MFYFVAQPAAIHVAVLKKNRSKLGSILKRGLIGGLIALFLVEVLLRLFGYSPYNVHRERPIEIHGKKAVVSDPILGYRNASGIFDFKYPSGRKFTVRHDDFGARNPNFMTDPDISFYGCSFTYGYGVNDTETYPYFVGELSGKKVRNAGCNGYGLTQAYLKMQEDFENGIVPAVTVISYASFLDERTRCTPSWQQELFANKILGIDKNIRIPYVSKTKGPIHFQYIKPERQLSKMAEYSSLWYRVEKLFLKNNSEVENRNVAVSVLEAFQKLCKKYDSQLVVVGLMDDDSTTDVLKKVKKKGMQTCQFKVDITKDQYNLFPDDGHPSPEAYKLFARTLLLHLELQM